MFKALLKSQKEKILQAPQVTTKKQGKCLVNNRKKANLTKIKFVNQLAIAVSELKPQALRSLGKRKVSASHSS